MEKNTTRRFGWYEKPGKKIADFPCHGDLLDLLSWPGRVTCLLRSKLSTIWIEETESRCHPYLKLWIFNAPILTEPRKKKTGWLGYIGDYTTLLYRDNNEPL